VFHVTYGGGKGEDPLFCLFSRSLASSFPLCYFLAGVTLLQHELGCLSQLATQRFLIRVPPAMLLLALLILAFHHGRPGLGATFSFERPHDNGNDNDSTWTLSTKPTELGELISEIFKPAKLPVTVKSIADVQGNRLDNGGRNSWNAPMGKDILIVDIETGILPEEKGLFNIKTMDWDAVEGSGMLTVPHFNHYAYCER